MNSPLDIALAFIERINAQDVEGLCALMTEDHRFVDSLGTQFVGREEMREGWKRYFALFPDYRITVTESFVSGDRVALFGQTLASYQPNGRQVEMRAAWLGLIRENRVAEWRVYADNEPARAALRE